MIATSTVHRNFFSLMKMAKSGIAVDFHYLGDVYRLTLEPTGAKFKPPPPFTRKARIGRSPLQFDIKDCYICGFPKINNICSNKKCDTNTKPKL